MWKEAGSRDGGEQGRGRKGGLGTHTPVETMANSPESIIEPFCGWPVAADILTRGPEVLARTYVTAGILLVYTQYSVQPPEIPWAQQHGNTQLLCLNGLSLECLTAFVCEDYPGFTRNPRAAGEEIEEENDGFDAWNGEL